MPITNIKSDTTVEKLVTRVYGKLPAAKLRAATAATLAANPHLGNSTELPAGTVVVVPELDTDTPVAARADARVSGDTVKALTGALAEFQKTLLTRMEQREAALDASERVLESAEFKGAVANAPDARPLAAPIARALKTERDELAATRALLGKEVRTLEATLEKLGEQIG